MAAANLTASRLREVLHYSPETGEFTWATRMGSRALAGQRAGYTPKSTGYVVVRIGGVSYQAHRLAWLYVHGVWPKNEIDHRDGNGENNRFHNLREATRSQNAQNLRTAPRGSSSGFLGVSRDSVRDRWVARIKSKGRSLYLGRHLTAEAASAAYIRAKRQLHLFNTL